MPSYAPAPLSWRQKVVAWTVAVVGIGTLSILVLRLLWEAPLLVSGGLGLVVLAGYLSHLADKKRMGKLRSDRLGTGICEFARSFDRRKVDTFVIRAVYEEMQELVGDLPLRREDRPLADFALDEGEVAFDFPERVAARTGRIYDPRTAPVPDQPVETLGDFVVYFNSLPRRAEASSQP